MEMDDKPETESSEANEMSSSVTQSKVSASKSTKVNIH